MKVVLGTKIHNHIQKFYTHLRGGFLEWIYAGKELIELRKMQVWKHDGSEMRSWREWVDKSLYVSGTTADRLIRNTEKWGDILITNPQYADVDPTKLELIPSSINGQEEMIKWIEFARNLSVRGLKDMVAEYQGRIATDKCEAHDFELTMIERCKVCGLTIKKKHEA